MFAVGEDGDVACKWFRGMAVYFNQSLVSESKYTRVAWATFSAIVAYLPILSTLV